MTHFGGLHNEGWPLPPRGISVGKTNHRAGTLIQYTYLCDRDDTCLAVAYSQESEAHSREQIAGHVCPQLDGSRGLIPTGKTLIQKMWDEGDDGMDAYQAGRAYKEMDGKQLQGFIRGIAEVLTFCTVPCYKVTDDVLKELYRRWKMRQGQIPFAPTPSYNYNPHIDAARASSVASAPKPAPVKSSVRKSAPIRKLTSSELVTAPPDDLLPAQREAIKKSYHAGDFNENQLAEMFGVSPVRILAIAGPKALQKVEDVITVGLF